MSISARINHHLAPMGLKLQRMPRSLSLNKAPTRSAGHQVELIGASGVGKSYLAGQFTSQLIPDWLSRGQISKQAVYGRDPFKELESKDSTLVEYLLRKKQAAIWSQSIPLWRKHRFYTFHTGTLAIDAFAREFCLPTYGVFMDEGVQQNFTRELLDWYTQCASHSTDDMQRLEAFMQGRSLVLLDASLDQIVSNLKKRHAQLQAKMQNDWLAWLPEEELLEKIREGKERKQRWTKIAQALGVATLELDASEELSVIERKVLDFLETIQREKGSIG